MSDAVVVEKSGSVTTVILSRPEAKNAVDGPTAALLANAFRAFEADEDARVAVFCGAGGTFCAGADLKAFGTARQNRIDPIRDPAQKAPPPVAGDPMASAAGAPVSSTTDGPMGPTRMMLSKPVIAAISGHAVAGGLELALWCDLRVADDDAVLGVFCRRFGVPLIDGGTIRLPRLIGLSRALDLILTGRLVDAREALAFGLVNRVVASGTCLVEAKKLARELSQLPQAALLADRQSAYDQHDLSLEAALARELSLGQRALPEAAQGAARFSAGAGRHGTPT